MILKDLMGKREKESKFLSETILQGRVIAMDGCDGKVLFDTKKNKPNYIKKFMSAEVTTIWSSTKEMFADSEFSGAVYQPCTMIYLAHNSWKED